MLVIDGDLLYNNFKMRSFAHYGALMKERNLFNEVI